MGLDVNKTCGPDTLTPKLLKTVADEVTPALTLLFKLSYSNGKLPKDWKKANATAAYKKGEKYNPANYRPISLTCIACKLLEHCHQAHNDIPGEQQFALHRAARVQERTVTRDTAAGIR